MADILLSATDSDDDASDPSARAAGAPVPEAFGAAGAQVEASWQRQQQPGGEASVSADHDADVDHGAGTDAVPPTTPTAPIARVVPRRIDTSLARLSQTVHDTRLGPAVQAAIGATLLRAEPLAGLPARSGARDPAVIELSVAAPGGAARPVFVELDLDAHPALAIVAWPDRAASPVPTGALGAPAMLAPGGAELALRQAVAGVLLDPLAGALAQLGFNAPRIVSVTRRPLADCVADARREPRPDARHDPRADARFDVPPVALSVAFGDTRIDCTVALGTAVLATLDALIARTASEPWRTAFPALTLPGSAIVGTRSYAVDTLAALEPGDVLLRCLFPTFDAAALQGAAPDGAAPRVVAAWGARGHARVHAGAALDGRSLTLTQEWYMSDELDSTRADIGLATDRPDEPIVVGAIELPVQFEIDTVALPLDQLSALGPGYVVELPVPAADAQLRLVVHGQTVGFGELVTVGEHLGVRIIRMAHRHGSIQ
ncbi:type III secretion system cytoplasmic ring protein SctQ [Burkholderia gladioli]|uniref:type III secretion system cytoplasmic ring protein SctQ n=1 Tax=Burkholderia gladioli TaxID=28095 RepID=UPI0016404989|nr:type III secretion system cytoplasmic ring protein SctQ [Burkholderia gladioli]